MAAQRETERDDHGPGFCPWCGKMVSALETHIEKFCEHPYLQWYFRRVTPDTQKKTMGGRIWEKEWEPYQWQGMRHGFPLQVPSRSG